MIVILKKFSYRNKVKHRTYIPSIQKSTATEAHFCVSVVFSAQSSLPEIDSRATLFRFCSESFHIELLFKVLDFRCIFSTTAASQLLALG